MFIQWNFFYVRASLRYDIRSSWTNPSAVEVALLTLINSILVWYFRKDDHCCLCTSTKLSSTLPRCCKSCTAANAKCKNGIDWCLSYKTVCVKNRTYLLPNKYSLLVSWFQMYIIIILNPKTCVDCCKKSVWL